MGATTPPRDGYYLCLISPHGLIRGADLELGRDADTGGQTRYVVELARALAARDDVAKVDLLTRRVVDGSVDAIYAEHRESLAPGADIVRIDAGPEEYLAKEQLWDHIDSFVDNALAYLREQPRLPDVVHGHYADAGYVGARLTALLGLPLIQTGHSLGRVKRRRLLASGLDAGEVEERYNMARRIEAEETTLACAERIVTSTRQEIEEQYGLYDYYRPERMRVIPPGTDLARFHPPDGSEVDIPAARDIARFLTDPDKPMILVLARPDPRKNLPAHVEAYARDAKLQRAANLVIVAGTRDDINDLDDGPQEVLTELLFLIDRHDLYGKVAYPKRVGGEEIPALYRLAARSRGVHVNAALTEPFGLTLIEAAATGLPIVATADGGPRDIISNCSCGVLVDPLDPDAIAAGIRSVLLDDDEWDTLSRNGLVGVRKHYSWPAHATRYVEMVRGVVERSDGPLRPRPAATARARYLDRAVFSDIDNNLLGRNQPDIVSAIPELATMLRENRRRTAFGIATGRGLDAALRALRAHDLPEPDILITAGGTRIHYAPSLNEDEAWPRHIDWHWSPRTVQRVLSQVPGLERQQRAEQSRFKLSYYYDAAVAPSLETINALLLREDQSVNATLSFGQYLDILPIRASKGLALRYAAMRWGIDTTRVLVAGGSCADEDMMRGNTLAAVVANRHDEELSKLEDIERIYFTEEIGARGIIEAIAHYDFFGDLP